MTRADSVLSTPPTNTPSSVPIICAEDQMRAAIRGWLHCLPDRRPSARALGARIAEIAASMEARARRLRKERREVWWMAEAATRSHPAVDPADRMPMVRKYRAALVMQLLTPAWDANSVKWKQTTFANGQHTHTDVNPKKIERAIADDLAWLAAHPTRRSNSEAMAKRREFNEAMRQRIRVIAATRNLSDEEIKPALKLKHQKIARFCLTHGVSIKWLLGGDGPIFNE